MACNDAALRLLVLLLVAGAGSLQAARILAMFPFPSKSHFLVFSPLLEELATRGHQVVVLSAFPRSKKMQNYTDLALQDTLPDKDSPRTNLLQLSRLPLPLLMVHIWRLSLESCEKVLRQPATQRLIHGAAGRFDLVIYEPFFSECAYGLLHRLKAPSVQLRSNTVSSWMGHSVGNPCTYSYVPDLGLGYPDRMTFAQRLANAVLGTFYIAFRTLYAVPRMEGVMRKYFPDPDLPSIYQLETNASFLLLNSHVVLYFPRPLTHNTAEVGGMHIRPARKLPSDLQVLLDQSHAGLVYFSLGTGVQSMYLPNATRAAILKALSRLKQDVLWKWEQDALPGQPKNVHIRKWIPQRDVLEHPNVKAFITHGGLLSIMEATYQGIPLIVIPMYGDQHFNAAKARDSGYAVVLDYNNITETSLRWALREVLYEPRYRKNARRVSALFRDQPQKPMDRAVFWVEYVLRHRGAPHMRSAALDLGLLQYLLIDVLAVVALASLAVALLVAGLCKWAIAAFGRLRLPVAAKKDL